MSRRSWKPIEYKFILLGDSSVGKSSIFGRLNGKPFNDLMTSTIGTEKVVINFDDVEINKKEEIYKNFRIVLFDTAGQERYRAISLNSIKSADGIILMFDLTDQKSYDEISNWVENIKQIQEEDYPMILVGNKCDLEKERIISNEEGIELSKKFNLQFFEVSNKTNKNIEESGNAIIKLIIERKQQKIKELTKDYEILENFELDKEKSLMDIKDVHKKKCCS